MGEGPLIGLMEKPVPKARRRDPDTSKRAAAKVNVGSIRAKILVTLHNRYVGCVNSRAAADEDIREGMATFEIARRVGVPRDHVSPHMAPLCRLGFIKKAGYEVENDLTGTESEAYILTEAGIHIVPDLTEKPAMGLHSQAAERLPASRLAIPFDTSDEIWKHLLDNPSWPPELEQFRNYEREDDMGDNILRVYVDDQGDVYVSTHIAHSARFCTKVGGGHSLRVRAALLYLAYAIMKDNGGKHAG